MSAVLVYPGSDLDELERLRGLIGHAQKFLGLVAAGLGGMFLGSLFGRRPDMPPQAPPPPPPPPPEMGKPSKPQSKDKPSRSPRVEGSESQLSSEATKRRRFGLFK